MSKITKAFETKVEMFLTRDIGQRLLQFQNMHACAGIRGDSELQKRARINHFGGVIRKTTVVERQFRHLEKVDTGGRIPARPFINKAIPEQGSETMREFEQAVAEAMEGSSARITGGTPPVNKSHAKMTGSRRGPYRILLRVAREMRDNQRNALNEATPMNAPATVAKKGFDRPLYESGELLAGVRHWVE